MIRFSRREGQSIFFADHNIEVSVAQIDGRRVTLGVSIPEGVAVELDHSDNPRLDIGLECRARDHQNRDHLQTATLALYALKDQVDSAGGELLELAIQQLEVLGQPKVQQSAERLTRLRQANVGDCANPRREAK